MHQARQLPAVLGSPARSPTKTLIPPLLMMTTSTRDDRVHPYHARAFVGRLRLQDTNPARILLSTFTTMGISREDTAELPTPNNKRS